MVIEKRLVEIIQELASRPRHEKVRALVYTLLTGGLGASSRAIDFEKPLPEASGRADALLGRTVFEFKSDLRRERGDAEEELSRYLPERERTTKLRFVGLATDGADWVAFEMRGRDLVELGSFRTPTEKDKAPELLAWLDSAVALSDELPADALTLILELGRESVAYLRAFGELSNLWSRLKPHPDVLLKRQLWSQLLAHVYGKSVDEDQLWFQHTYLTAVAKTVAVRAVGLSLPNAANLISGKPFLDAGIYGAVESDFFDWILVDSEGRKLIDRLARQVARFRLDDVKTDVLKVLYESLIDPAQRHDLGEYYTPDWLAARVCERAISKPLADRVLDPACGSGSFLFHALRRFIAAARSANISAGEIATRAAAQVVGMDIHPVAVIIARVTYLLALGEFLRKRDTELSIPVYLGDALQWNVKGMMATREVVVTVPPAKRGEDPTALVFPAGLCEEPAKFDAAIETMLQQSEAGATKAALSAALKRRAKLPEGELRGLEATYRELRRLKESGRDHIWGYVARNLSKPLWLSGKEHRADVVVGNPPWLSFRYMDTEMQTRVRNEMRRLDIWVGGSLTSQQDLSGLFFVRAVELYLKRDGIIAFVMPMAALSRGQFAKFRTGSYTGSYEAVNVHFTEAWTFDEHVQPLFPVPSAVIFGTRDALSHRLPERVRAFAGQLPFRDAPPELASKYLRERIADAPGTVSFEDGSPYKSAFRPGAPLYPRMLCVVEPVAAGRLGSTRQAPVVTSRRSKQEKIPWKGFDSLQGQIETEFLRPVFLGESIAPYRVLAPVLGVIPFDKEILSALSAANKGWPHLSSWLAKAEALWNKHGSEKLSFSEHLNFFGQLECQFPPSPLRVVYTKSGTLPAAALIEDDRAVVELQLYWMAIESRAEGEYLCAIINSEAARKKIADIQARGQWGARHFDRVFFTLPIPRFNAKEPLHSELALAASRAATVASRVSLRLRTHKRDSRGARFMIQSPRKGSLHGTRLFLAG